MKRVRDGGSIPAIGFVLLKLMFQSALLNYIYIAGNFKRESAEEEHMPGYKFMLQ